MSAGIHFSLDNLPERYRVQVARKLSGERGGATMLPTERKSAESRSCASDAIPCGKVYDGKKKREPRTAKKRTPNQTEARFNHFFLKDKGAYEAVTFNFCGSKYTPDYVVWDDNGKMTCYEVKGSYRLPSEGRARTAFLACRELFPSVTFRWFKMENGGHFVEHHRAES